MIDIQTYIEESLFSGQSVKSTAKKVEADIEKEAIEKLRKYCYVGDNEEYGEAWDVFKDGDVKLGPKGYEITTNSGARGAYMVDPSYLMLCYNIDEKSLDYKIAKFEGTLILGSSETKNLTWLFTPDCEFEGRLVIEWNEFLTSLKGCPKKVDCFECVYNDKLNSLQGAPQWCNEFTWSDNGKGDITEKDIRKYLKSRHVEINVG
jgi:hypothetical protein